MDVVRGVIGTLVTLSLASTPALAQSENVTEHVSLELDLGFLSAYDDSDLWDDGFDAGVAGLWALNATTSLSARFGISHWSYVPDSVVDDLVPPGSELLFEQSSGQVEVLALTPLARYEREEVFPWRLGAFVHGGVGIAYVKTFARTEVEYVSGSGTEAQRFEINESDWFADVFLGAGLSRAVTSSTWIELMPSYRVIFGDETTNIVAVSLGFRLRV